MEKAVLIGLITPSQNEYRSSEYLDELAFLVETAGAVAVKRFTQRLDVPHPKTFVGKGKLEEIQSFALVNEIDLLVFDDELSPSQVKNLGVFFGESIKVLDRSNLILDIFAGRAQTAQAKAQVELAQLEYTLPRLTKMWTHLSRQKGGIGMRGPGEREIETDRRIVRNNIALLKTRLQKIDQQNETRRKSRSDKIRVALVGYTNVGKSTLMNQLSDSEILAENKLFATLDTTVRKVVLDTVPFLLSDTVGFIRKLPHHLVESFKSTLDEVREADILVHVVDMAHDAWEAHILVVDSILAELGAVGKPTILVFNKIDLLREKLAKDGTVAYGPMVKGIKKQYLGPKAARVVFVSAAQKEHMDELKKALIIEIKQAYKLMYPYRANPY
ncbi:MAG: GTPase HflX [Bacteroidetes bacterium]|nr:GTPase HflX [Bacteroidota bacterium]